VVDGEVGVEEAVPEHVAADEGEEEEPGFHFFHFDMGYAVAMSVGSMLLLIDRERMGCDAALYTRVSYTETAKWHADVR
jgi:hypothetical protein